MSISWSDDDNFESDHEDEAVKNVTALIGRYESDEEVSYEELDAFYRELCIISEEVCQLGEK